MLRSPIYAFVSVALFASSVYYSLMHESMLDNLIHYTSSRSNLILAANAALCLAFQLGLLICRFFFGTLRPSEISVCILYMGHLLSFTHPYCDC